MSPTIGLLHGADETFPPAFLEAVAARGARAEAVKLGELRLGQGCGYSVLIDRISHRVGYYRTFLKNAVLVSGTYCINNPFRLDSDNAFLRTQLAAQLHLPVPRSVALPSRDYAPGVDTADLQNLVYPLPWEEILEYVGLPALLRPVDGSGAAVRVGNLKDLWEAYGRTGQGVAMLVESLDWEEYLLALCVGGQAFPAAFDPVARRLRPEAPSPGLADLAVEAAARLHRSLGYELAGLELAMCGGTPYLVALDPFPVLDWWSISEQLFSQVVGATADLAVARAREGARMELFHGGWPFEVPVPATRDASSPPAEKNLSNTSKDG